MNIHPSIMNFCALPGEACAVLTAEQLRQTFDGDVAGVSRELLCVAVDHHSQSQDTTPEPVVDAGVENG